MGAIFCQTVSQINVTHSVAKPHQVEYWLNMTGQFPDTVMTVYYIIYMKEVRKNTYELGQDLDSEPEFSLGPLKYKARVVLTSRHGMQ